MAAAGGSKFVALFKQGLNEVPELLFAGTAATIAGTTALILTYYREKNDYGNKIYKVLPVLMRPDDPRVAKVHKP